MSKKIDYLIFFGNSNLEILNMKKNKLVILVILLLLSMPFFFWGCDILFGEDCPEVPTGKPHYFWTVNISQGIIPIRANYCEIATEEPYESTYANIYIQSGKESAVDVTEIGNQIDDMYQGITSRFGEPYLPSQNAYNGGDPKLTILILDIIDGYDGALTTSYVGGYFYSVDYMTAESAESAGGKSNEQAIIYVDMYPQDLTSNNGFSTIAHEFQHLIHFSQKVLDGGNNTPTVDLINSGGTPTWINEGFSLSSEHIWAEEIKGSSTWDWTIQDGYYVNPWPVYSRISYFNNSDYYTEGHPLFKWMRGGDTLSNYSNAFLFFQYMRTHSTHSNDIFEMMMTSDSMDEAMITELLSSMTVSGTAPADFNEMFERYMIASRVNNSSGIYGYNDETGLKDAKAWVGDTKIDDFAFQPGAFIYRKAPSGVEDLSGTMEALVFNDDASMVKDFVNGDSVDSNEYIVIYNTDTNPEGSAATYNVPSGAVSKDLELVRYNLENEPMMIDWTFDKPLQMIDSDEIPKLRTKGE